jgi:hypothetical protein
MPEDSDFKFGGNIRLGGIAKSPVKVDHTRKKIIVTLD